jgi:hypothetical protein
MNLSQFRFCHEFVKDVLSKILDKIETENGLSIKDFVHIYVKCVYNKLENDKKKGLLSSDNINCDAVAEAILIGFKLLPDHRNSFLYQFDLIYDIKTDLIIYSKNKIY